MRRFTKSSATSPAGPASILRGMAPSQNNSKSNSGLSPANAFHPPELLVYIPRKNSVGISETATIPIWTPLSIMAASAARVAGESDDVAQIASDAVVCYGNDLANFWRGGKNENFEKIDPMERVLEAANRASDAMLRAGGKSEAAVAGKDAVEGGGKLLLSSNLTRPGGIVVGVSKDYSVSEGRDDKNAGIAENTLVYNNDENDREDQREEEKDKENVRESFENGRQGPSGLPASSTSVSDQRMVNALMTLNQAIEAELAHNNDTAKEKDGENQKKSRKPAIFSGGRSVASRGSVASNTSKKTVKWRDDDPSLTLSVCYEEEEDGDETAYTEDYRGGNTQMSLAGKEIHLIGKDEKRQDQEKEKHPSLLLSTVLFPKFEIPDDFLQIQPSNIENRVSESRTEVSMAHNIPEDVIPTPFFSWNALFPNWDDTRGNDGSMKRGGHPGQGRGNASTGAKSSASSKPASMAPLFNILARIPVEDASVNRNPKRERGVIHVASREDGENLASQGNNRHRGRRQHQNEMTKFTQEIAPRPKKQGQRSYESEDTSVTTRSPNANDKSDTSTGNRSMKSEQRSHSPGNEQTPILSNILPNTLLPAWDARTAMSMRSGNTTKNGDYPFAPLLNLFLPIPPSENEERIDAEGETNSMMADATKNDVVSGDVKGGKQSAARNKTFKFGSSKRSNDNTRDDRVTSVDSARTGNGQKRILPSWTASTEGTSKGNYSEGESAVDTDYESGEDVTRDGEDTSATSAYRSRRSIASSKARSKNRGIIEGMDIFEKDRSVNDDTFDDEIKYDDGVYSEVEPKSMTTKSVMSRHQQKCGNCCLGVFGGGGNDVDGDGDGVGDDASSNRSEDEESSRRSRGSDCDSGYFSNVEVDDLTILKQHERMTERRKKKIVVWKRLFGKLNCFDTKTRAHRKKRRG
ncbi:hypothetical protein ACHAXS_012118 [Conticribra weissflogii]